MQMGKLCDHQILLEREMNFYVRGTSFWALFIDFLTLILHNLPEAVIKHGRWSRGGGGGAGVGAVAPDFAKFLQNLPFLPQILAFLCLQPPHVPALSNSLRRLC